ncbi:hypothetical protein LRP50_25310, partial [Enterovibrio sp. ZSDZ42]
MKAESKHKLKDESVYARAALLIILLPLSLMVATKLFVIFSDQDNIQKGTLKIIGELFRSSDWSLASGMIYVSIIIGIYESSQGKKSDGLRLLYRGAKLACLMLFNFLVYFCATAFPSHIFIPTVQTFLFLQAV